MSDILVSKYREYPVVAAYIGNELSYLSVVHDSGLGSIYLSRVENVVKNIHAAFVRFGDGQTGYLPFKDIVRAMVVNRDFPEGGSVRQGDEIIVQLQREGIKLKKPGLTCLISHSGTYVVVTLGRKGVGASTRLSQDERNRLLGIVKPLYESLCDQFRDDLYGADFGLIIRTETAHLSDDDVREKTLSECRNILSELAAIIKDGHSRRVFSCIRSGNADEIDTHINRATGFLKSRGETEVNVIDSSYIYSPGTDIEKLLRSRVWLKSGAFLVIEQLESFNAIDVNTGKAIAGKNDIIKKINFEAAEEIFRQIRLRNLSGMILIDFINMKSEEDKRQLCDHVSALSKREPVHTEFVDMTGLGIIELIRTKNDKSLKEIFENEQSTVDNSVT